MYSSVHSAGISPNRNNGASFPLISIWQIRSSEWHLKINYLYGVMLNAVTIKLYTCYLWGKFIEINWWNEVAWICPFQCYWTQAIQGHSNHHVNDTHTRFICSLFPTGTFKCELWMTRIEICNKPKSIIQGKLKIKDGHCFSLFYAYDKGSEVNCTSFISSKCTFAPKTKTEGIFIRTSNALCWTAATQTLGTAI